MSEDSITFSNQQDWVLKITPDRKIVVNDDVEVSEVANTVFKMVQELIDQQYGKREGWHLEWVPDTESWFDDIDPLTCDQITKIWQEADVSDDIQMKHFFEDGKELAKKLDAKSPNEMIDRKNEE